jgi:tetratricopeptide (TPR) repeat protein
MLPRHLMLTTKNWRAAAWRLALSTTAAAALAACSPSGPRLLLQGERLIQQGKPLEAIPKLRAAVNLLPENAQAWNHLGLAYHGAGESNEAVKAYQQALERDPSLHSTRYNLGCLYLEHGQLQPALTHLSGFVVAVPDSIDGWMRLATAQTRSRQTDVAERSYQRVLRLSPRHAEALNNLGLIQLERKRLPDAFNYFSMAAQQQPPHAPAILNLAILHHQHLGNPLAALQAYSRYVELQPNAADDVRTVMLGLEAELAAATVPVRPPASEPAPVTAQALPPAAETAAAPSQNVAAQNNTGSAINPPVTPPAPSAGPAAPPEATPPARTSALETARSATRPPVVQTARESATPKPEPSAATPAAVKEPLLASQAPAASPLSGPQPNSSAAPERFEPRDPAELPPPARVSTPVDSPAAGRPARLANRDAFRSRVTPLDAAETRVALLPPGSSSATAPARAALPSSAGLRYAYRNPSRPAPGNSIQARHALQQGIQTHQQRHFAAAIDFYRDAIDLDPSLFEAHYNLGLAWFEMKDPARALSAYEDALSINPTSFEARYNFALALERSRYYQDAARELEQVLSDHPSEVKAHLTLARLYAQQFNAPDLARPHYRKVLELDPRHPSASEIRYWLGTSP